MHTCPEYHRVNNYPGPELPRTQSEAKYKSPRRKAWQTNQTLDKVPVKCQWVKLGRETKPSRHVR